MSVSDAFCPGYDPFRPGSFEIVFQKSGSSVFFYFNTLFLFGYFTLFMKEKGLLYPLVRYLALKNILVMGLSW